MDSLVGRRQIILEKAVLFTEVPDEVSCEIPRRGNLESSFGGLIDGLTKSCQFQIEQAHQLGPASRVLMVMTQAKIPLRFHGRTIN